MAVSTPLSNRFDSTAGTPQSCPGSQISLEGRHTDRKPSVRVGLAVAALLLIHGGLLAYSATRHSPTLNEPGHLAAGLSHWRFGRFELYRVNPPLVRMVAALPVIAAGYTEDWSGFYEIPGARSEFRMGEEFITANGERSLRLFTIARWACIPFSLIGGLFCFSWARELWDSQLAGVIALTAWCFEPSILAHGELITPDCAASSFGVGAGYFFWRWLKRPNWGRSVTAGLLLGLAELTKTTWLLLFGLWPLIWLSFWRFSGRNRARRASLTCPRPGAFQLAAILLIAVYVLNLGYAFDGTLTPLKDYTFVSSALTGAEARGGTRNRFADSCLAALAVPFPRQYVLGIDIQKCDFEDYGPLSYLRGEWKDGGWWYYYLYGLAVKTTHGLQLLLLLAIATLVADRRPREALQPQFVDARARDIVVLLAPVLAVLVLVSSQLEFNQHVRYVLPVLGFIFVLIGATARWFRSLESPRHVDTPGHPTRHSAGPCGTGTAIWWAGMAPVGRLLTVAALLATVASTLRVYPHQLAYFNELAGGPENGHHHLLASNLDWEQDLLLVMEWMQSQGVAPSDVNVVTTYPRLADLLIPSDSESVGPVKWDVVSCNKVAEPGSTWRARMPDPSTRRIGYSYWVFPAGGPPFNSSD